MIKKLKELGADDDNQLASAVRASAHQIWQAGLGAFAKAQKEGGRVFSELVQEGAALQKRTRSLAEDRMSEMTEAVGKVAGGVGKQAAGSWDKLEQVFEERVARALGTIGVPTRKDIEALGRQVEQLREMVADMAGQQAAQKAAQKAEHKPAAKARAMSAANKPALKTPARKAAARKPAAKKARPAGAVQD
jgi:poly(hydroxyalkanoate) granule-associated protein